MIKRLIRCSLLVFMVWTMSHEVLSQTIGATYFRIGVDVLFPVLDYRDFTSNVYGGFNLGILSTTRNPEIFYGIDATYGLSNTFSTVYSGFTQFGEATEFREDLYNTHLSFAFSLRYMPEWFQKWQPYGEVRVGARRLATFLSTVDTFNNSSAGSSIFASSWGLQYGLGTGVIIPLKNNFAVDLGFQFLETSPMSHYLRVDNWEDLNPSFTTDIFEERKTALAFFGLHVSLLARF